MSTHRVQGEMLFEKASELACHTSKALFQGELALHDLRY